MVQFIWFNKSFKVIVMKTKFENHYPMEWDMKRPLLAHGSDAKWWLSDARFLYIC